MDMNNEFALLQMRMESVQELIELKQEELAELVKKYMKTYAKYIDLAAEEIEVCLEDYDEDEEECHDCFNCKYSELDEDAHPCFNCTAHSNWKAE